MHACVCVHTCVCLFAFTYLHLLACVDVFMCVDVCMHAFEIINSSTVLRGFSKEQFNTTLLYVV